MIQIFDFKFPVANIVLEGLKQFTTPKNNVKKYGVFAFNKSKHLFWYLLTDDKLYIGEKRDGEALEEILNLIQENNKSKLIDNS